MTVSALRNSNLLSKPIDITTLDDPTVSSFMERLLTDSISVQYHNYNSESLIVIDWILSCGLSPDSIVDHPADFGDPLPILELAVDSSNIELFRLAVDHGADINGTWQDISILESALQQLLDLRMEVRQTRVSQIVEQILILRPRRGLLGSAILAMQVGDIDIVNKIEELGGTRYLSWSQSIRWDSSFCCTISALSSAVQYRHPIYSSDAEYPCSDSDSEAKNRTDHELEIICQGGWTGWIIPFAECLIAIRACRNLHISPWMS